MRIGRKVARLLEAADHYLVKVPQRMPAQVTLGLALILVSHFPQDAAERAWLRDAGAAVCTFAVSRWLAQQGRRRETPEGKPVRNPTIRFKLPEDR